MSAAIEEVKKAIAESEARIMAALSEMNSKLDKIIEESEGLF